MYAGNGCAHEQALRQVDHLVLDYVRSIGYAQHISRKD